VSAHEHTPQDLRDEIDATRRELGATVEQLAAKTAVRKRWHDRLEGVKDDVRHARERGPVRAAAIGCAAMLLVIGWTLSRRTA
jgi:Protein of unknown function (DUF3618)